MKYLDDLLGAAAFLLVLFGPLIFIAAYEAVFHPLLHGPVMIITQVALTIGSILAALNYWAIWRIP